MRSNFKHLSFAIGMLLAASCSHDRQNDDSFLNSQGNIRLSVSSVAAPAIPDSLAVKIANASGISVFDSPSISSFPAAGFQVSAGSYTVSLQPTNKRIPFFDKPIYSGNSTVSVTTGATSTASIALKQVNFCVGIAYSDKFKAANTSYSATIESPNGTLTYAGNEARLGYFYTGPLTIKISYTDSKGVSQQSTHTIDASSESIKPATKLLLTVKLPDETTGGGTGGGTGGNYTGYYQNASGKTGAELKSALTSIISTGYKTQGYDALYTAYKKGDIRVDGTGAIWDIYSDVPGGTPPYLFQPDQDRCGSYASEGDCFNREHCIPQSWFSEASPMVSDYLHILPTDGKVNGQRSNYPFGEVGTVKWTSKNGSKLGSAKSGLGYSNTVFEPIDAYKGDVARIYFYFVTRYAERLSSFEGKGNEIFNSANYLGLDKWTIDMFIRWSKNDPVSEKERTRNTTAEQFQGNRNPYVDHPEFIDLIWGTTSTASPKKASHKPAGFKYEYITVK